MNTPSVAEFVMWTLPRVIHGDPYFPRNNHKFLTILKKKKDLKIIFGLDDFNCPFSKLVPLSGPFEKKDDRQCAFHGGTASRAALVMTRMTYLKTSKEQCMNIVAINW